MKAYNVIDWGQSLLHLRAWNRSPSIESRYVVPSESDENKAYIVREITAFKVPKDVADAVIDEKDYLVCSCSDFKYRKFPKEEPDGPLDIGECKHVEAVKDINDQEKEK